MHRQPNQGIPSFNEYTAGDGCYMEYLHRPVEVSSSADLSLIGGDTKRSFRTSRSLDVVPWRNRYPT